jgi:hypothetical protein
VVVVAQVGGRDAVEGLPGAGAVPALLSAVAMALLSRPGPMRQASSIAAGSVQRSWMAFLRRVSRSAGWLRISSAGRP